MPYASDKQRRFFHAAEKRGEISSKTIKEWDDKSRGKSLPETATKSNIAGPELQLSDKRKKFYDDIIFNPENYSNRRMVKFDGHGQWKMVKYEPSGLALDNRGGDRYGIGDRKETIRPPNKANMDNKLKTVGVHVAGGFHSEVVKSDKNGQWSLKKVSRDEAEQNWRAKNPGKTLHAHKLVAHQKKMIQKKKKKEAAAEAKKSKKEAATYNPVHEVSHIRHLSGSVSEGTSKSGKRGYIQTTTHLESGKQTHKEINISDTASRIKKRHQYEVHVKPYPTHHGETGWKHVTQEQHIAAAKTGTHSIPKY